MIGGETAARSDEPKGAELLEAAEYLRALARSWWLVLIAFLAGGIGGFVVYDGATPQYRSSVRLVVTVTSKGLDQVSASALAGQRATALSQVAPTAPAVADAAKASGHAGAAPSVTAGANSDQPFVTITVVSADRVLVHDVADAYVKTLSSTAAHLLGPTSTPFELQKLAPATMPGSPFEPSFKRDVGLGLAAGLVLGVSLALLREALNRSVRSSDELAQTTGKTVLGTVPRDLPKKLMPALSDPRSARAEAYRQVRTSLQTAVTRRPAVIGFTSAVLGEGKTSVASNVAAVFSRAGHRVALIDADLRRPKVATFFGIDPQYGFADVLSGVARLEDSLTILEDGRLAVLTAGRIPTNPSEALGSQECEDILAKLAEEYEFVFVDTPPILPVTDALVLAPKIDGIVLVARLGYTSKVRISQAMNGLERVNATVLGVVPNQAGRGTDSAYSYSYQYKATRRAEDKAPTPADSGTALLGFHDQNLVTPPGPPRPSPSPIQRSDDGQGDVHPAGSNDR